MNTIEKKLADGLKEAGKKNLALSSVVPKISDDVQRDMSMENVAKPIAEAIFDGEARVFRVSVNDVNSMQDVCADILYILDDSGIIGGNPPLSVNAGDVVVFNGLSWQKIGGGGAGPAIDAYTKSETDNRISEGILAHNALSDSHADIRHSITAEATARAAADTSLGGRIDDAEEAIGNEADERAESDRDLQSQIDAITSKSDVVDVVASYVELVAYDTSALGDNDVVKVLEDETHDDAESYYRWNITTETWGYIGSQGPFVTPAEMQTALGGKVDKVTGKGLSTNDFSDSAKSITDNIFLATYNSTSYADIKAAYDSGKTILCRFTDSSHTVRVATFDRLTNSTTSTSYAYFASVTKADAYELVASKSRYGSTTTWSNTYKTWGSLAEKSNVTNADISGTISDSHIASASTWNGKADKVGDATNGHLAGLDGNGNITDSGVSPSDIASDIFIATYGTTTIAQIEAAYNANKAMFVKMGGGNPGIALFTTRYTINGVHSYWFYRKYGRDYGANEDQHYAYVYIDSSGWHDYSFTSPKKDHDSTTTEYGEGSETKYGHVQLTSSVTQNSSKAVTSGAVYAALQNLPQPTQEVFIAEYGVTAFGDIINAINAGKIVVCHYSFNDEHYDAYLPAHYTYLEFMVYFSGLVDDLYISVCATISSDNVTTWSAPETKLGTLLSNIIRHGSESNYVTERGTIKPIPPSAYPAITKDADYTIQTSTVVTLQQTNRLYKIHVRPSSGPHGDVQLNVSTGLTGVVFLDLKVGYDTAGCIYYTYNANYLKWTDIFGVEQKMRLYPDWYDGQYMPGIYTDKTYFRLKIECYNGEIIAVTSFGDLHFEASGLVAQSVTSYKIANSAVTKEKIATAAVTNDKIGLGAVGTTELADNAVTHDKIAFGAVSTDKQACGYFDWTIDSHYNGGSRNYIGLSGSQGGSGNDGSTNQLHTIFANGGAIRFSDVMVRFNVTYGTSSNAAYVYCNVESLPKFTLFKLKTVAVGHSIIIRFRTNATTEALAAAYVNENVYYNTSRDYTIDAGAQEDICFFRGNDSGSNCRLYLISNWTV